MDNNAKLRPLYLAKILYERTDEDHYLTTMQLAQILEEEYGIPAHRQTIKTDIELLQRFGMDIQEVKSTQNRYNLISRQFEIAELKLLIDAVQSSKFISKERSEQMVSKIVALAGQHKAEELKRNASVEGRVKSENRQDLLIVDAINEAINARKKIAFQYFSYNIRKQKKLRHETANEAHYAKLHPARQTLSNRIRCLRDLKDIGYQTGAGMMIGAPYQTAETLAQDMEFLADLRPEMVGMGPFLPHKDTPFRDFPHGSAELTLYLLSLVRLLLPDALLPATTALGTLDASGRQQGVLSGCNVVMPNLSPMAVRQKYLLYDNKAGIGDDGESSLRKLRAQMQEIGYEVAVGRGDYTDGRTKQ